MQIQEERVLRASLREVELGLFYVAYDIRDLGLAKHLLPPYQVGTCASDARQRIEQKARECGYEAIAWEDAPTDPSFIPAPAIESTQREL